MIILLDTNILTRSIQPASAHFHAAIEVLRLLNRRQETLCLVPQNLYEFWAVCTRPAGENGLGLTTAETHAELARIRSLFTLLPDMTTLLSEWEALVLQYDCKGKSSHDARLVAALKTHGITAILTFNPKDFNRFSGINVLVPQQLLAV